MTALCRLSDSLPKGGEAARRAVDECKWGHRRDDAAAACTSAHSRLEPKQQAPTSSPSVSTCAVVFLDCSRMQRGHVFSRRTFTFPLRGPQCTNGRLPHALVASGKRAQRCRE